MSSLRPDRAMLAAALWVTLAGAGQVDEPLPAKTDIPADFSTTLCPSAEQAVQMLDHITVKPAPHNHIADTTDFFAGLAATGCAQDSAERKEPITISQVLRRKTITLASGEERYAAYAGRNSAGGVLYGVVDESGNDRAPRSPLERWLVNQGGVDGVLTIAEPDEFGTRAYACATTDAAQAAVRAIATDSSVSDEEKDKAFLLAIKAGKCLPAKGRFQIRAILEERAISCGEECDAIWTALDAVDDKGATIGLIYDASLM